MASDDEEDEEERTKQRGPGFVNPRPVVATFQGKRLEGVVLPRADPRAMAAMKGLDVRTPELELKPQALQQGVRPPAQTIEEETVPTMPAIPDADVQITVAVADEEPDTITRRDALSDADIITTPNALSEPDSITPQATTNMLELLKRIARKPESDAPPPRPPAHTIPLVDAPDRTLPLPKDAKVVEQTVRIPKEEARQVVDAFRASKDAAAFAATIEAPPPSAPRAPAPPAKPRPKRRRWPVVLVLLLLVAGAVGASQSPIARAKVGAAISRIRQ